MKIIIFFKKIQQKLHYHHENFFQKISLLPKKYLSKIVITVYSIFSPQKDAIAKNQVRKKPHLLILRNDLYSNKSKQPSTEIFHLDNTLRSCNLATFDVLTYEDFSLAPICDLQFIKKCGEVKADAIIFSSWWYTKNNHPSEHAIQFVRKNMKIPIVTLWWDTCSKSFGESLKPLIELFDVHVVIDNPNFYFLDPNISLSNRFISLWPPQDAALFHPQITNRTTPLSFLGQISSYRSYRSETLEHLAFNNIPGKFLTNDRDTQVTHEEYAGVMRNSKISLNFSHSVNSHQLKSRVLEVIFSGAMLLESENEQISKLFTPMKDYVPFTSKEDLVQKINYYLKHEDELNTIAKQGLKTALEHYNSKQFWSLLLKKLNLL